MFQHMFIQRYIAIFLIYLTIFSLIGIVYFAIPGYLHILALGDATATQPTGIFVCVALFVASFLSAVYITPERRSHIGPEIRRASR